MVGLLILFGDEVVDRSARAAGTRRGDSSTARELQDAQAEGVRAYRRGVQEPEERRSDRRGRAKFAAWSSGAECGSLAGVCTSGWARWGKLVKHKEAR